MLSRKRLLELYSVYQQGFSINQLAEIYDLSWYPIWNGFRRHGLRRRRKYATPKRAELGFGAVHVPKILSLKQIELTRKEFLELRIGTVGVRGYAETTVNAIWSDYLRLGEELSTVARRWKRSSGAIAGLLNKRGLRQPDPARCERVRERHRTNRTGCFARHKRATPAEIHVLIAAATKVAVPAALRWEFQEWPIEKRADFIKRIRERLRSPDDRPNTPFSKNVKPFDYATPEARAIKDRLNFGLTSREAICKIDTCSQGVIYKGELWFWRANTGYIKRGLWTSKTGRPILHRVIWEKHHGRKIPAQHQVFFKDRNPNNFAPSNLALRSMAENAQTNLAAGRLKKARAITAALLARSQEKKDDNDYVKTIESLKAA